MSIPREKPNFLGRLFVWLLRSFIHTPLGIRVLGITKYFYKADTNNWFDINEVNLELSRLPPEFDGYRIVQLSDFHIGTWLTIDKLRSTINPVNKLNADLLVFTGDFISHSPENFMSEIAETLAEFKAKDAKVYILGNHDHWTDPQYIRSTLAMTGFIELSNAIYNIKRDESYISIAGVDDYMVEADRLDEILLQLPNDSKCCLLLAHEPDFADYSSLSGKFDLQLSGHSHGGQIVLPSLGPIYLPRYARKYPSGLYKVNDMYVYTNGGLGTAEIQFRYNTRAEITVFTVKTSKNGSKYR